MSGLASLGGLPGFAEGGMQVAQGDIDQYVQVNLYNPSVSNSFLAAGTSSGTTPVALQVTNRIGDWPRNLYYNFTGGTTGGTVVINVIDQFGNAITEQVALGSTTSNQNKYGTVIAARFMSGTFYGNTSINGTFTLGYGTASTGGSQSNWFGLMTKIGGTSDVKNIRWVNNGTVTGLNKGTALGTLIDATRHAFQGTSGVAITDTYTVTVKPTFDNSAFGTMSGL